MKLKQIISTVVAGVATLAAASGSARVVSETVPLDCSRGGDQSFRSVVSMPSSETKGSVFTVHVDSASSGKISHSGLKYIHNMMTEFRLPAGTTFVEGSARITPGTGTPNIRDGAHLQQEGDLIRLVLPGHVENGTSYTPPGFEFQLRADAPPGTELPLKFNRYGVTAKVTLLGDMKTTCNPVSQPATIGVTRVAGPDGS